MLIINPYPGQEEANARYLEQNNAGIRITDSNQAEVIKMLNTDIEIKDKLKTGIKGIKKGNVLEKLYELIIEDKKQQINENIQRRLNIGIFTEIVDEKLLGILNQLKSNDFKVKLYIKDELNKEKFIQQNIENYLDRIKSLEIEYKYLNEKSFIPNKIKTNINNVINFTIMKKMYRICSCVEFDLMIAYGNNKTTKIISKIAKKYSIPTINIYNRLQMDNLKLTENQKVEYFEKIQAILVEEDKDEMYLEDLRLKSKIYKTAFNNSQFINLIKEIYIGL